MKLIVKRNPSSPSLSIVAAGLGGARLEPGNKAGVASLAAQMLTRGTRTRTAEQIAATVDALGGQMGGTSGYNSWALSSQWLARDWRRGLSLMTESILMPTFPSDELARARQQAVAAIRENEDDPNGAASLLLRRAFYGAHPYGRSALGSTSSLSKIAREDVERYWKTIARPQSTVIAVYAT
jgi:zinc protease